MTNTFDRMMKKPSFKKAFDKEYDELLISELICAMMSDADDISVRKLANEVGISPTAIQNLRSGIQKDVKMSNFIKISQACGFQLTLERNNQRIPL